MRGSVHYKGIGNYKSKDEKMHVANIFMILIFIVTTLIICINIILNKVRASEKSSYVEVNSSYSESIESYKIQGQEKNQENDIENIFITNQYLDDEQNAFIESIFDGAMRSYNEYGILPSITICQAILESGWGKSELAVNHNNLFGIKADSRWDGAVATIVSSENYSDKYKSNFRKYTSVEESIVDHGEFLFNNTRYRDNGLFDGESYIEQAQSLENAGYSTVTNESGQPIYADKLINLIEKYNLMMYDEKVITK